MEESRNDLPLPCRVALAAADAGLAGSWFASLGQHADAERLLDDRPRRHDAPSTASSPTATRSTPATTARSPARPSTRRPRSTASTSPRCGTPTSRASAAPSRAPWPRTSTTTRSSPSARTCRPATTRVVTFEMCGNDGLQARSSFAGQSGTCNYAALDTAREQLHDLRRGGDGLHQRQRLRRHQAEDHLEPVLPGLRRRQRAEQLHRRDHRRDGQQAEHVPALDRRR